MKQCNYHLKVFSISKNSSQSLEHVKEKTRNVVNFFWMVSGRHFESHSLENCWTHFEVENREFFIVLYNKLLERRSNIPFFSVHIYCMYRTWCTLYALFAVQSNISCIDCVELLKCVPSIRFRERKKKIKINLGVPCENHLKSSNKIPFTVKLFKWS